MQYHNGDQSADAGPGGGSGHPLYYLHVALDYCQILSMLVDLLLQFHEPQLAVAVYECVVHKIIYTLLDTAITVADALTAGLAVAANAKMLPLDISEIGRENEPLHV